jgi:hypothetical protein
MRNLPRLRGFLFKRKTSEQKLLQKIKQEFREIRKGEPGRRFLDHYRRTQRRENGQKPLWKTIGYVTVGLVLVICGLAISLPPGLPGFLLWIPGFALLAARFKPLAKVLDGLEERARQWWKKYIRKR